MESTGRFEKYFLKSLRENNTSGAGGAFGDGPSTANLYVPSEQGSGIKKSNTPGDSRIAKPLGTGKVQTRKGSTGGKKKRRKKKDDGIDELFLTGEEDAEDVHKPVKPGILKKRLGELSCSKVRAAKSKLKDKGTHYAKALQRYLNYHC
jgi:hypothetical protein|tara:strand:+ start:523 stop:969 length:447 start_codon:yes stop_codon:yes gene_type:complete